MGPLLWMLLFLIAASGCSGPAAPAREAAQRGSVSSSRVETLGTSTTGVVSASTGPGPGPARNSDPVAATGGDAPTKGGGLMSGLGAPESAGPAPPPPDAPLTPRQQKLLAGARSRLGDVYDASYYSQGYPPAGKSACVDVLYYALGSIGVDLQEEVRRDARERPELYPNLSDPAIDHRRVPNLRVYFGRHAQKVPLDRLQAGDFVLWSLTNDGVTDHCGVVSDRFSEYGIPLVIHQFPPECREEDCLGNWTLVVAYRWNRGK